MLAHGGVAPHAVEPEAQVHQLLVRAALVVWRRQVDHERPGSGQTVAENLQEIDSADDAGHRTDAAIAIEPHQWRGNDRREVAAAVRETYSRHGTVTSLTLSHLP